ncbi:hypothetical protein [Dyella amyloliquefaciens]|nr:hypothetical protein [Dyella amyloliquefaciens]
MDSLGVADFIDEYAMARNMQVLRGSISYGCPNEIFRVANGVDRQ